MYSDISNNTTLRIIDANLNRVKEGLRVVEDIARFALQDKKITFKLKKIRHSILGITKKINHNYIISRNSINDVGIFHSFKKEFNRKGLYDIVCANTQRIKEGLRVLEEVSKIIDSKISMGFKDLRFKVYTIEKEIIQNMKADSDFSLYVIIDREFIKDKNIKSVINKAVKGGATVIQYRDKISADREIVDISKYIRKITRKHNISFIVNDRVDIALISGADGVHLGEKDISVKDARRILGDKIIGATAHSIKEAKEAEKAGADYLGVGPIYATSTKKNLPLPKGILYIKQIKKEVKIPLVAIGGITIDNAYKTIKAGADGIATISAVFQTKNIQPENIAKNCKILYNLIRKVKK